MVWGSGSKSKRRCTKPLKQESSEQIETKAYKKSSQSEKKENMMTFKDFIKEPNKHWIKLYCFKEYFQKTK